MFRITVRTGISNTIESFEKISQAARDLKPFWRGAFREFIIRRFRRVFVTNGYGQWRRTSRPNPILRDTRRMYRSYTREGYRDNINKVSEQSFEWGTSTPYAGYHETGTYNSDGSIRMHARPVVGAIIAQRGFEGAVTREFEKYFRGIIDAES